MPEKRRKVQPGPLGPSDHPNRTAERPQGPNYTDGHSPNLGWKGVTYEETLLYESSFTYSDVCVHTYTGNLL